MTKQEVANEISKRLIGQNGVSPEQALSVINAFTTVVKEAVTVGDQVTIRGFGAFKSVTKVEKKARNITKGTTLIIPEHQAPKFIPSKEFMEQVRSAETVAEV